MTHWKRDADALGIDTEFKVSESISREGWFVVKEKKGSSLWEVVASVFGRKRAEIVREALTKEPR